VLAATVTFGVGNANTSSLNPTSVHAHSAKTNSAKTNSAAGAVGPAGTVAGKTATTIATTDKSYSGGHLMAADPNGGYWTVNWLGAVTAHGGATVFGSPALSGLTPAKPIVGIVATPDGQGYWLVGSDGGVFTYGDAVFYGSTGALDLNQPVVGAAATPDGKGYWLVAADGGVFTFGDATFYGSIGALHLNEPVVGMAATPGGKGYWLVASDGGVFTFGDATYYGSTSALHLNKPIVGAAATPDGSGYWLVAGDGGIFTFGDAKFPGSLAGAANGVLGIIVNPSATGDSLVQTNGDAVVPSLLTTPVAEQPAPTTPASDGGSAASSGGGASTPSGSNAPPESTTTTTTPKAPTLKAPTPAVTTPTPTPTTTTTTPTASAPEPSSAGTCSATSTTPPTTSEFPGYSLTNTVTGPQIPAQGGYSNYGADNGFSSVLPPSGYINANHIKVSGNALEELGYNDPSVGAGVVGDGMQLANDTAPSSGGGFTYCYSLSGPASSWQQVDVLFIAWPLDNVWGDGEIDFMWGGDKSGVANWDIIEADGCTTNCQTLAYGTYPTGAPGTGEHAVTVLWKKGSGDSFYIDGHFVTTVPTSTVGTPAGSEVPAMQVQDLCQCSSAPASDPLTASLYWIATYAAS
jgi:hypothetical protein